MNFRKKGSLITLLFISLFFITGCSINHPIERKSPNHSRKDGQIISVHQIHLQKLDDRLKAYRMMYWSNGVITEAYLSVPQEKGTYSLEVNLHGGWIGPVKQTHVSLVGGVIFDKHLIEGSMPNIITVVPMYRGYGESGGTVNGLEGNTKDTQNAITAVKKYLGKNGIDIYQGETILMGTSTGGGVALKVASQQKGIASVIAISPYLGADLLGAWYKEHLDNSTYKNYFTYMEKAFGPYNPSKSPYIKESIDYKKINVPVLLIQGKKDEIIPWQTVKRFSDNMKADGKDVTLKLVPDGDHALTNKQTELMDTIQMWFKKHPIP